MDSRTFKPATRQEIGGDARSKSGLKLLAIVAALLVCALIGAGVVLDLDAASMRHQVAAQDDAAAQEAQKKDKTTVRATSQVPGLTSLIGMDEAGAIEAIGHGAVAEDRDPIDAGDLRTRVQVPMTDQKGDALSGTPTVVLFLDGAGTVRSVSYRAATSALGYGPVSFVDVIEKSGIVQNSLQAAGLTAFDPAEFSVPDRRADYTSFESDGKTSIEETLTFQGVGSAAEQNYHWSVTVDYDYAKANASGNLADTARTVAVTVSAI